MSGDPRAVRSAALRVPASTSNLGAAFDAVGLALDLYLDVEVTELEAGPSRLEFRGRDAALVPSDSSNLIWRAMEKVAAERGRKLPPFALRVENEIPITRGLGSSATAALAAVAAADFLADLGFGAETMLSAATALEGHPDNVAPALLGGLVASISGDRIRTARAEFPEAWTIVAVIPDFELETRRARAALPTTVPHRDAVYNVQRAAFLMTQLALGRKDGVREAMRDRLHQPYRAPLVPGLDEILELDAEGLVGIALSGAGPTVVAFADGRADEIGAAIRSIFARRGIDSAVRRMRADNRGLVRTEAGGGERGRKP